MKKIVIFLIAGVVFSLGFLSGCIDGNTPPTAAFSMEPDLPQAETTVFFNSTSSDEDGEIENYTWYLKGEILSYESKMIHQFEENGSYVVKLSVTDDDGATNSYEKNVIIGGSNLLKERLLGLWTWGGNNQTGNWTFYQNNTLKSVFTGQYGASTTDLWHFEINETELCFTQPSDDKLDSACYDYEFSHNYTHLTVSYGGETAEWIKVS